MIYELLTEVRALVAARDFPIDCVYGPLRAAPVASVGVLAVFERAGSDSVRGQQGANRGPLVRDVAGRCTLFARSSLEGARQHEHEALCDQCVDAILVAASQVVQAWRTGLTMLAVSRSGYLDDRARDLLHPGYQSGVIYQLDFSIPRGVREVRFGGEARETGFIGEVQSRTDANLGIATGEGCNSYE